MRNLAPTPLSSQEAAAVEQDATAAEQDATAAEQDATAAEQDANAVEQDANAAEAPAESPLPVSAVDWRRIKIFREKLQQTAVLDRVMRQGGDDAGSAAFRSALAELRNNTVGESTWRLLLSRCKQNLPADEIASFNNTIQLYGTRAAVNKYNYNRIRDL